MTDSWNPELYKQYMSIRRPALDTLFELIKPKADMRILDVGCGSGDFTAELHQKLQARSTYAVDNSENMLSEARKTAAQGISFGWGDIDDLKVPGKFDLVFSNGVFQYSKNKENVLRRFVEHLAPGGQIAIQAPHNPTYMPIALGFEIAQKKEFAKYDLGLETTSPLAGAELLHSLGLKHSVVRLQAHSHPLPSGQMLFDWLCATFLNYFEARMPEDSFRSFHEEYKRQFFKLIPAEKPFHYVLQRLYIWIQV
jgi:trans-aconitate 2-methyltransferase